jgi:hypothetical protein
MHWVLQDNVFGEEGWDSLVVYLTRFGIPFSCHKVIPFVGDLLPEPVVPDGENVIVMGSYSMALYAQKMGWTPGSFANDNHEFQVQLAHWGDEMVNATAEVLPYHMLEERTTPFFIRPVDDTKSFPGTVMDWQEYCEWRDRILALEPEDNSLINEETMVMVSPLVKIYREYRLWVVDGEIVTASLYKEGTRVRYDDTVEGRVLMYAAQFVGPNQWQPARAYCLDIFDTEHGLKIGEVNNINSAGFYKADMQKLVYALESMSFQEEETNG